MPIERYRVRTGDLDVIVEAQDHKDACVRAIRDHKPSVLGSLVASWRVGDDEDMETYTDTMQLCVDYKLGYSGG